MFRGSDADFSQWGHGSIMCLSTRSSNQAWRSPSESLFSSSFPFPVPQGQGKQLPKWSSGCRAGPAFARSSRPLCSYGNDRTLLQYGCINTCTLKIYKSHRDEEFRRSNKTTSSHKQLEWLIRSSMCLQITLFWEKKRKTMILFSIFQL